MAIQVMPPAALERRADDVELPDRLYAKISLFARLKSPPNLAKFPGALRLRRFRQGEVICRHGEPGWTAFYTLTRHDVIELREYPRQRSAQAPQERARAAELLQKALDEKTAVQAQRSGTAKTAKELADLGKKLDTLEKEVARQEAALATLDAEIQDLPALQTILEQQLQQRLDEESVGQACARAAVELHALQQQAQARGDAAAVRRCEELRAASAAKKREVADIVETSEPQLAQVLRALARAEDGLERLATVHLPTPRKKAAAPAGLLARLGRFLSGGRPPAPSAKPAYIPTDTPRDVEYSSRRASLHEGELFGELSCLNRTPRSATVIAVQDCYVLEMLRNILDSVRRDPGYQAVTEKLLRARVINSTLGQVPVFSSLDREQLAHLGGKIEFVQFEPGTLICDEHEEPDSLYVIVGGIVKVMTNVSWLLREGEGVDWKALREELAAGGGQQDGPARQLYELLPGPVRQSPAQATPAEIVRALNDLLRDPLFHAAPGFIGLFRSGRLGTTVWRLLAGPQCDAAVEMHRCNRLLLEQVCAPAFPTARPAAEQGEHGSCLLREAEVADWKALCGKLAGEGARDGDPVRQVWQLLPESVRAAVRAGKTAEPGPEAKSAITAGLNELLQSQPLLLFEPLHNLVQEKPALARRVMEFLPARECWTPFAFQRFNRALNRLLLEALCPRGMTGFPRPAGPVTILAYRSQGELIGEMGLLERQPRSATCVAYNHPENDPERAVGPVQMFRLTRALFEELLANVPGFQTKVAEVVAERHAHTRKRHAQRTPGFGDVLAYSDRAEQLGLVEGQRLMLIDLSRCTRCDECVKACVSTHDDGRSRLFLNGPRFDTYLVPTTCRACLDPVCMIGCPVGSIHRGDNREIVIEDWCIGCNKCAEQCPYGAIQMHDLGLIPEGAHGWMYLPAALAGNASARAWVIDRAPFRYDRALREQLQAQARAAGIERAPGDPVLFRYELSLTREQLRPGSEFTLEVISTDAEALVWVNGTELRTDEKAKRGRRSFEVRQEAGMLRTGKNVVGVQVTPAGESGDILFDLRLDPVRKTEGDAGKGAEVNIKPVTQLAVVCDLCSAVPTGPACVTACPHEAALRVDATRELPTR